MGWIVKLNRKNMFGDDVFPSKTSATYAIVCAIRGAKRNQGAVRYMDAKVVKTSKSANVTK